MRNKKKDNVVLLGLIFEAEMKSSTRSVACYLVYVRNKDTGQCNPAINTIAKACDMSRRSVQRALDDLESIGMIERRPDPVYHKGNWQFDFTHWFNTGLDDTSVTPRRHGCHPQGEYKSDMTADEWHSLDDDERAEKAYEDCKA